MLQRVFFKVMEFNCFNKRVTPFFMVYIYHIRQMGKLVNIANYKEKKDFNMKLVILCIDLIFKYNGYFN